MSVRTIRERRDQGGGAEDGRVNGGQRFLVPFVLLAFVVAPLRQLGRAQDRQKAVL
jgi:hypothetical protein